MICYRDKVFCPFWESCKSGITCDRALTEGVILSAEKWWGSPNAPIDRYAKEPKCFEVK